MKVLLANTLSEEVLDRDIPLADNLYELLHPDRDRGIRILTRLILDTKRRYLKNFPLVRRDKISVTGGHYTFYNNFEGYLLGNIAEDNIKLIPEATPQVMVDPSSFLTSNHFKYDKPNLFISASSSLYVTYLADYPYVLEPSDTNGFTEESGIYFVDSEDVAFYTIFRLLVLEYLQSIRQSMQVPAGLTFFEFSEKINYLREEVKELESSSSSIYNLWANHETYQF